MKNKKVKRAVFHIGIQVPGTVKNSIDVADGVEMELWPPGVYIEGKNYQKLIPYANCKEIDLIHDDSGKSNS